MSSAAGVQLRSGVRDLVPFAAEAAELESRV